MVILSLALYVFNMKHEIKMIQYTGTIWTEDWHKQRRQDHVEFKILDLLYVLSAIRHSVDRALPALPALSALLDLQFLQLSQLFQLSQFCQFFHSSDTLSSPSSSNFEIENWKSWESTYEKSERTNRVGKAGKGGRGREIGDPRDLERAGRQNS